MEMKCDLIIKDTGCRLEFDFKNHIYQDACCLYKVDSDKQNGLLKQTDSQLFNDFRELIFADFDFENNVESVRAKKRSEYLRIVQEYIKDGGDDKIEVKTI